MIEIPSGLPRKSSAIFGNLRKFLENIRQRSCDLRTSFGVSSEIFGKWSEIFRKSSKTPSSLCLYNKKNITLRREDMSLMFSWQEQYCSCHSNIKLISSRHSVISSIYYSIVEHADRIARELDDSVKRKT